MRSTHMSLLIALLALFAADVHACGLPLGGGGCCPPPPPPCCGRRKREVDYSQQYDQQQLQQHAQQPFIVPSVQTEHRNPCPQAEWLATIKDNMSADSSASAFAVQAALYKRFGAKFNVVCLPKGERVFAAGGDGFCSHEGDATWCQASALLG